MDEWLLETAELPVLRVYGWLGGWGSVGYFGNLTEAQASFPGVEWVRRWTGGGTVDHRADWTYTVVAPAGGALVGLRGAESYRMLHAALAEVLVAEGIDARLSSGAEETGAALCFENPVSHDLVGAGDRKLAGAGQRRTNRGLLHQGSVALLVLADRSARGAVGFVSGGRLGTHGFQPPEDVIAGEDPGALFAARLDGAALIKVRRPPVRRGRRTLAVVVLRRVVAHERGPHIAGLPRREPRLGAGRLLRREIGATHFGESLPSSLIETATVLVAPISGVP